ncbi:MAG: hypothetical protein IPI64_07805 [Chloracidobacterium sp.]|nr:hypothetical protein [Chloracidobacterium sp.]
MKNEYEFPPQVIAKGSELGYQPDKLALRFLVPLIQVAWAEGHVQATEQKTILSFAGNLRVNAKHAGYDQLLSWFEERPTDHFFESSIDDLRELLDDITADQAAPLRSILRFGCVEVAQAAGDIGLLRGRSNIRREEIAQLQHIGERLGLAPIQI